VIDAFLSDKFVDNVVSGTARGVDRFGEYWARKKDIEITQFPADWGSHGKRAGYLRNKKMAEYADSLVLIWDGKSAGSKMMKLAAEEKGLIIYEHIYNIDHIKKLWEVK
jgi:hypothetical protein